MKKSLQRCWVTAYDDLLGSTVSVLKQIPVLIRYFVGSSQKEKKPDEPKPEEPKPEEPKPEGE